MSRFAHVYTQHFSSDYEKMKRQIFISFTALSLVAQLQKSYPICEKLLRLSMAPELTHIR